MPRGLFTFGPKDVLSITDRCLNEEFLLRWRVGCARVPPRSPPVHLLRAYGGS